MEIPVIVSEDSVNVAGFVDTVDLSVDVGRAGRRGSMWFIGSGVPNDVYSGDDEFVSEFVIGDMYLNVDNGDVYRFEAVPGSNPSWGSMATNLRQGIEVPVTSTSSTYSISVDDHLVIATAALTATLPDAILVPGRIYRVKNNSVGTVVVDTTSSQTIDGAASKSLTSQYDSLSVVSDSANWVII